MYSQEQLIEKLRPVSFQFKDSPDERFKIGFIAQKTEEIMGEYEKDYDVVNYDKDNDIFGFSQSYRNIQLFPLKLTGSNSEIFESTL